MKMFQKLTILTTIVATGLVAVPALAITRAEEIAAQSSSATPLGLTCNVLADFVPCTGKPTSNGSDQASTSSGGSSSSSNSSNSSNSQSLFASLYAPFFGGSRTRETPTTTSAKVIEGFDGKVVKQESIVLARTANSKDVYRIIGGKRFLIPNTTVFNSYGFRTDDIIILRPDVLYSYPRVRLIQPNTERNVYYLTETGLTRRITTKKVFESYADREQDIVVINSVEFTLYPQNRYVYNEDTFQIGQPRDVYRITDGIKKKMSGSELIAMKVAERSIAPINQTDFDSYKTVGVTASATPNSSSSKSKSAPQQKTWVQYN